MNIKQHFFPAKQLTTLVVLLICSSCLLFSGCSDKSVDMHDGASDVTVSGEPSASSSASGDETVSADADVVEEGIVGEDGIIVPPEGSVSEGRTTGPMMPVYFDFDSYVIQDGMAGRMEANARFLQEHPELKVEIQGNCDERGTNEYNLALGEKRALAAKRYLINLGVNARRISVVSLGEEKPLETGSGESAWAMNRRDDFVVIR